MTSQTWIAGTANWSIGASWSGGVVPNAAADAAVIDAGGTYIVTVDSGQSYALDTLTLNAAGATLAVAGTLTFSGSLHTLSLQAGMVRTDSVAALSSAVDVTIAAGATLDVNGHAQTIAALAGAGVVLLEGSSVSFGGDNSDASLGGSITGNNFNNASLSKTGSGTLTLAGATVTLASLYVVGGNLAVATGSTSLTYLAIGEGGGTTASAIVSGGTLALSNALQIGDFGGTGTVSQTGGTVALSFSLNIGNQGGSGVYDLSAGLLRLGNGALFDLGRNSSSHAASHGTLNLSGGQVDLIGGTFILGDLLSAGTNSGSGQVVQTGGTFSVEAASGGLNLSAFGNGEYDLNGGVLQVGGANLIARWTGSGTSVLALGGGAIQVIGSALTSNVAGTLTAGSSTTIDTNGLGATWNGGLSGAGELVKSGLGNLTLAAGNTNSGDVTLAGGTLDLAGPTGAGTGRIVFQDNATAVLRQDGAAMPTNVIAGFVAGDSIDLAGLTYNSGFTTSYDTPSGVMSVINAGSTVAALHFGAGNSAVAGLFHLVQDAGTGTVVTNDSLIPCFLRGSRIGTPDGEVAVEALRIGDLVSTLSGAARPIRWIGTGRAVATAGNGCDVAPVIIRAGALADGMPTRDLAVTRHHAVLVGDVLVPAQHLVNARSVVWDDRTGVIDYYHIELDTHDVLLAEGAPVESFRDDGSAALFANGASRVGHAMVPCRPVVESGPLLENAWRVVAARLGPVPDDSTTDDSGLHVVADGARIDAEPGPGGRRRFGLPAGVSDITIVSRHGVPAALGQGRDLRRLGVALAGISVVTTTGRHDLALDEPADGFHPWADGHRWTKGRARVALGADAVAVELQVVGALRYRIEMSG